MLVMRFLLFSSSNPLESTAQQLPLIFDTLVTQFVLIGHKGHCKGCIGCVDGLPRGYPRIQSKKSEMFSNDLRSRFGTLAPFDLPVSGNRFSHHRVSAPHGREIWASSKMQP